MFGACLVVLVAFSVHRAASIVLFRPVNVRSAVSLRLESSPQGDQRVESNHPIIDSIPKSDEQAPSSCPFSMRFPRYRINLSAKKERAKDAKKNGLWSKLFQANDKLSFEREFRNEPNKYMENTKSGVHVMSILWRWAATTCKAEPSSIVLGFPEHCSSDILRQWMDIVEWMQDRHQPEGDLFSGGQADEIRIHATLLDKPFTAIRLERVPCSTAGYNTQTIAFDEGIIEKRTKSWVKRVLVDMGICPFTKSVTKSGQGLADVGVPVGQIAYHTSNAGTAEIFDLLADTWEAIHSMMEAGPSGKTGVSSILLAAPNFDKDFELWAGPVFVILEASVVAAQALEDVGVVCFHPQYKTPDGSSFPGFGHMHSVPRLEKWFRENSNDPSLETTMVAAGGAWQRRTPHATINVLRAKQLEAAEERRSSCKMYTRNIERLVGSEDGVGLDQLEDDLERDRGIT